MCYVWISEQTAIIPLYSTKLSYNQASQCLQRGTDWVFKLDR